MKKIYKIIEALEEDETGTTPQVIFETSSIEGSMMRKLKRLNINQIEELDIQLPRLILNSSSKKTDWLTTFSLSMGRGKLISEKLFRFLKKLKLPKNESIELSLNNNKYSYCNLKNNELSEYIDFSKSSFLVIPGNTRIKIKSSKAFDEELKKHTSSYIKWNRLKLKEDIFEKFDVVNIGYGDIAWYTTENLKDEFKNFSGLRLEEVNNISISRYSKLW